MSYGTVEAGDFGAFDRPIRLRSRPPESLVSATVLVAFMVLGAASLELRSVANRPAAASTHAEPALRGSLPATIPTQNHADAAATPGAFARSAALRAAFVPLRQAASPDTASLRLAAADVPPTPLSGPAPVGRVPQALQPQAVKAYADAAPVIAAQAAAPQAVASQVVAQVVAVQDVQPQAVLPQTLPALPPEPALVREIPLPAPRPRFAALAPVEAAIPRAAPQADVSVLPRTAPAPVAVAPAAIAAVAPAAPAQPGFFEKLFSGLNRPSTALGYAPADGGFGTGAADRYTAIYDIAAHTVYLPDGRRLEAHSGLGASVDDPRSVAQRMRGATPPNLYELTPREAMFHGVRALRMTPTGGTTFGRAGLLTHSYMLRGREGESNGCVVFRDYDAFLAAYDAGIVRRLLVVSNRT